MDVMVVTVNEAKRVPLDETAVMVSMVLTASTV